jgi:hypothetical protein
VWLERELDALIERRDRCFERVDVAEQLCAQDPVVSDVEAVRERASGFLCKR